MNVYSKVPDYLPNEETAVNMSTADFDNLGRLTVLTQVDQYDIYRTIQYKENWHIVIIDSQLSLYNGRLLPSIGLSNELPECEGREPLYDERPPEEIAIDFVGTPYGWGHKSENMTDCSGLTYQVFRVKGIILPRFADGQYAVSREVEELEPGDLIFITVSRPVHVLLYLGGEWMIEACGLEGVFKTRMITFYDRWGIKKKDLFNGLEIGDSIINMRRV